MIRHLSASSIGMALRCGEQFNRRYIQGQIIPPSIAMGTGTGVHKAAETNFKQKIVSHEDLPIGDMTDAARDAYVNSFVDGVFIPPGELSEKSKQLNEGLNNAIRFTKALRQDVAPGIQPEAAEEFIKMDIGLDVPLLGYIDFRDKEHIGDLKTAKRSWPKNRAAEEIQTPAYKLLARELGLELPVRYHVLVLLKSEVKIQTPQPKITEKHIDGLKAKAAIVLKMVKAGVFPPADRGAWNCDPRWCGYFTSCPYVGNGSKRWT